MTASKVKLRRDSRKPTSDNTDNNRPWSVSERRAFFERLHTSTSVDDHCATTSTSADPCPGAVLKLSRSHKRLISHSRLYREHALGNSETKENVTPSMGFTPIMIRGVSAGREPPAKPRRTFAHDRELLRQASVISDDDIPSYKPPLPIKEKPALIVVSRREVYSARRLANVEQQHVASCSTRPPLPPKPTTIPPAGLRGRPAFFQLSHESDCVGGVKRASRASTHEHWIAAGHLRRYHSDESLYATPTVYRNNTALTKMNQVTTPSPSGGDETLLEAEPVSSQFDEALSTTFTVKSQASMERQKLQRGNPVLRRGGSRCRGQTTPVVFTSSIDEDSMLPGTSAHRETIAVAKSDSHVAVDCQLRRRVTKAKLVHRRTLAFYDQQVVAFCRRMAPQLFHNAIIVQLLPRDESNDRYFKSVICPYVPKVTFKFPDDNTRARRLSVVECAELFIPDFTRARPVDEHMEREEFMLTLTDEFGKRTFAYCIKYPSPMDVDDETESTSKDVWLPAVFAILSPIHAPQFYTTLAHEAVDDLRRGTNMLTGLLNAVFKQPFPANGSLCIAERYNGVEKRALVIRNNGPNTGRLDCSSVVQRMGPEVTVAVLAALMAEQKVLIGGDSVKWVCHAIQSLVALMQPFSWPYTLVPVLPDTLLDLADSPTPYLLGVLRNNLHKMRSLLVGGGTDSSDSIKDDVIIVDLDGGIFVPPPLETYSSNYKERSALSLCDKLLMPRKLALSLINAFREAIASGPSPIADLRLQKAMLTWFASLLGHYRKCGVPMAYLKDCKGDPEPLRASLAQLVAYHSSASSRRFVEWFVETGLFRDWVRRRTVAEAPDGSEVVFLNGENQANQRFDELARHLAPHCPPPQNRISHMLTRAHSALFHSKKL